MKVELSRIAILVSIVNSFLWEMDLVWVKIRKRLYESIVKTGKVSKLTRVKNFLINYRKGSPFQNFRCCLDC